MRLDVRHVAGYGLAVAFVTAAQTFFTMLVVC